MRPIDDIAKRNGCSPAQVALAWVLAKGRHIVPIPGTKRRRNLEQNVAAADIALSPADVATLEEAFPIGAAAGTRYGAESMRLLEAEQI